MAHQHRGGHGAHTARHGGDSIHDRLRLGKAHVTAQLALVVQMDAHIHHGLAGTQAVSTHGAHPAHGHHDHIRLLADLGQVLGAGVADGHGGIFPVQHHGGGLAHYQAAAYHHGAFAGEGNIVVLQNLQAGLRGAGSITQIGVGEHTG